MKAILSKLTFTAGLVLATALTLSCSDNEDKGSFGTCSEAFSTCSVVIDCGTDFLYDEINGEEVLVDEITTCEVSSSNNAKLKTKIEEECLSKSSIESIDDCIDEKHGECMLDNGICGSASLGECMAHFEKECWLD